MEKNCNSTRELISVIVPVYNTEGYLDECIGSIINQTYLELDIILVYDNGTTDASLDICRKWEQLDKRIRVYPVEHCMLGACRNRGLEKAQGKYISFIDSDDKIDEHFMEELYNLMIENDADMSVCTHDSFDMLDRTPECNGETTIYDTGGFLKRFTGCDEKISPAVWQRLYKHELVRNISFIGDRKAEDLFWSAEAFVACNRIAYKDLALYHYRVRTGSSSVFSHVGDILCVKDFRVIYDVMCEQKRLYEYLYGKGYDECADNVRKSYMDNLVLGLCLLKSENGELHKNYYSRLNTDFQRNRKWSIVNAFKVPNGGIRFFLKAAVPILYYAYWTRMYGR